jgi:hypothetical protein
MKVMWVERKKLEDLKDDIFVQNCVVSSSSSLLSSRNIRLWLVLGFQKDGVSPL